MYVSGKSDYGCIHLRPSVNSNGRMGERMSEMRGLHQYALDSFFESERKRIEDFLEDKWIPLFLKNFLATSGLMSDLRTVEYVGEDDKELLQTTLVEYLEDKSEAAKLTDEIAASLSKSRSQESGNIKSILARYVEDDQMEAANVHVATILKSADPAYLMIEWVNAAQHEINLQRREMLQPLEEAQRLVNAELAQAYADILRANGVVTARLEAAAKVKESQDKFMDVLGARKYADQLKIKLAGISDTVGKALMAAKDYADEDVAEGDEELSDADAMSRVLIKKLQSIGK